MNTIDLDLALRCVHLVAQVRHLDTLDTLDTLDPAARAAVLADVEHLLGVLAEVFLEPEYSEPSLN